MNTKWQARGMNNNVRSSCVKYVDVTVDNCDCINGDREPGHIMLGAPSYTVRHGKRLDHSIQHSSKAYFQRKTERAAPLNASRNTQINRICFVISILQSIILSQKCENNPNTI